MVSLGLKSLAQLIPNAVPSVNTSLCLPCPETERHQDRHLRPVAAGHVAALTARCEPRQARINTQTRTRLTNSSQTQINNTGINNTGINNTGITNASASSLTTCPR
ncbi:unnamed protein product [Boreogadus saida]